MISLERRDGRLVRIGHRGAPSLAPENTLASFSAAVEAGVDLVELDVLALPDGTLVVAHSFDLEEASHGALEGSFRGWSFERLREASPVVPTLEEALGYFANEAGVGIHLDLKGRGLERAVVDALDRFELTERSFVTSFDSRSTRIVAADARIRVGITVPRSVLGISDDGRGAPLARGGLIALRRVMPAAAGRLLSFARASALVLHHSVVGRSVVERTHARGAAVVAWTVDDPAELARLDALGVDAVVTNDPAIFASTLES